MNQEDRRLILLMRAERESLTRQIKDNDCLISNKKKEIQALQDQNNTMRKQKRQLTYKSIAEKLGLHQWQVINYVEGRQ